MHELVLVNLGCGRIDHPQWINFDLHPLLPGVRPVDVRQPLPLSDGSVDMCYSSHLLEHLGSGDAATFLREQHRVLKPQGAIRVAVPDLGHLCRAFVDLQARVLDGDNRVDFSLEYTYLELFDQATRTVPGGDLYTTWLGCPPEQAAFVEGRAGDEFRSTVARRGPQAPRMAALMRPGGWRRAWTMLRERVVEITARALLGKRGAEAVREGFFRASGEVHRVMYDEVRLSRRLVAAGFHSPKRMTATESRLPGFAAFNLDAVNGRVRKPDSLFMEAVA
jgi:predicted SAM-dependent methyltransferase